MLTEELKNLNLLLINFPESLSLLVFGIGLTVLTILMRGILNRFDSGRKDKQEIKKIG